MWFTVFIKRTVSVSNLLTSVEFCGSFKQLQRHDSVHLSSAYTDYSFSSLQLIFAHHLHTSEIAWEKRLRNNLFCVDWDVTT